MPSLCDSVAVGENDENPFARGHNHIFHGLALNIPENVFGYLKGCRGKSRQNLVTEGHLGLGAEHGDFPLPGGVREAAEKTKGQSRTIVLQFV